MVNKNKILSDLSKLAVDTMSTFSGLKDEIESIVALRVDKIINKMNLVKKEDFDVLKKMVQKLLLENENSKKNSKKQRNPGAKSPKKKKRKKNSNKN